jgi:hypothetical protein
MTLPEGWVAVPEEPTHEMILAGVRLPGPHGTAVVEAIYRAMLAAAPSLPLVEDRDSAVAAKLDAYEACHETAVDLGYPSITEALEHLEGLQAPDLSERVERLEGALREAASVVDMLLGRLADAGVPCGQMDEVILTIAREKFAAALSRNQP